MTETFDAFLERQQRRVAERLQEVDRRAWARHRAYVAQTCAQDGEDRPDLPRARRGPIWVEHR